MFETNLREERYLPFEGAGAISTWRLELPSSFRQFDYDTISDVVLHVRYTARDGGGLLKDKVTGELQSAVNEIVGVADQKGLVQMFSLLHQFPTEWYRFTTVANANGDHVQGFALTKSRFPFLLAGQTITINKFDLYAVPKLDVTISTFPKLSMTIPKGTPAVPSPIALNDTASIGQLSGKTTTKVQNGQRIDDLNIVVPTTESNATWSLAVAKSDVAEFQKNVKDLLLVCHYTVAN